MRRESRWLSTGSLALLLSVMLFSIPVFAQDGPDYCSSLAVPRVSQRVNDADSLLRPYFETRGVSISFLVYYCVPSYLRPRFDTRFHFLQTNRERLPLESVAGHH